MGDIKRPPVAWQRAVIAALIAQIGDKYTISQYSCRLMLYAADRYIGSITVGDDDLLVWSSSKHGPRVGEGWGLSLHYDDPNCFKQALNHLGIGWKPLEPES